MQLLPAIADDVITNIMSPIVSFQYPEDYTSEVLTNGGVQSPIVSYQYFEWPGGNVLSVQSSPVVSYYYQSSGLLGAAILHGTVADINGTPLPGATVSAMVYLSSVAQTTTDANGNYQLPSLGPGVYDLWAWDSTHQTTIRALTFNANTAEQDFQLKPLPSTPAIQQVNRQPNLSATIGAVGGALRVFDGTQFQPITPDNVPPSDQMTIVLTHGWIPINPLTGSTFFKTNGIEDWPLTMAMLLRSNGITAGVANIVGWDWYTAASGVVPPEENTPAQGVSLGQALLGTFGATYSQPVHFIGHSLGTEVNASAANYLHGDRVAQQCISSTPWDVPIHVTLLDEAEAALVFSPFLSFNGYEVNQQNTSASPYSVPDVFGWKSATPMHLTWADNYISEFGYYHPDAINVTLKQAPSFLAWNPFAGHSYAYQWYEMTVTNPGDCILGFQRSYEARKANISGSVFPPSQTDFPFGVSYLQPPAAADPLTLIYQSSFVGQPPGNLAESVVQGSIGVIQFGGNVGVQITDLTQSSDQLINQGFDYVNNIADQAGQAVMNIISDSTALTFSLTTAPPAISIQQSIGTNPRPLGLNDGNTTSNTPPMVWLSLSFPSNSTAMAFDFSASGNPMDDSLVCGIGTNNLFSLEAQYIPTNVVSTSRLIDVSPWSGTTNEIFFGFLGGTSTNATLEISNIRFYSVLPPMLNVQVASNAVVLNWPLWANGYVLQTTDDLSANSWLTVTNTPVIGNSQFAVTNQICPGHRFYRLEQPQQ